MNPSRRSVLLACALPLAAALVACAAGPDAGTTALAPERVIAIVGDASRSPADRVNDQRRKPVQMLEFIGIHPGWTAIDLSAGGGYTTELLARAVGPGGTVYGQSAPRKPEAVPPAQPEGGASAPRAAPHASADALAAREAALQQAGVQAAPIVAVVRPFEDPVPPEGVGHIDLATLMFNYHDLGHMGVDRDALDRAVFRALKPGGLYVIADHAGRPGTGITESGTLHRVEEALVRREVEAAGFKLVAGGDFLRNPNDPRDRNTPEPPQPKDEFVLKFAKP